MTSPPPSRAFLASSHNSTAVAVGSRDLAVNNKVRRDRQQPNALSLLKLLKPSLKKNNRQTFLWGVDVIDADFKFFF